MGKWKLFPAVCVNIHFNKFKIHQINSTIQIATSGSKQTGENLFTSSASVTSSAKLLLGFITTSESNVDRFFGTMRSPRPSTISEFVICARYQWKDQLAAFPLIFAAFLA
jgi:hypothetical protein